MKSFSKKDLQLKLREVSLKKNLKKKKKVKIKINKKNDRSFR